MFDTIRYRFLHVTLFQHCSNVFIRDVLFPMNEPSDKTTRQEYDNRLLSSRRPVDQRDEDPDVDSTGDEYTVNDGPVLPGDTSTKRTSEIRRKTSLDFEISKGAPKQRDIEQGTVLDPGATNSDTGLVGTLGRSTFIYRGAEQYTDQICLKYRLAWT